MSDFFILLSRSLGFIKRALIGAVPDSGKGVLRNLQKIILISKIEEGVWQPMERLCAAAP
jgi:hypothetical protein